VLAGHRGDEVSARRLLEDEEPAVRAAALGALGRLGQLDPSTLGRALGDPDPAVRRRACRLAWQPGGAERRAPADLLSSLLACLGDPDPLVGEEAAWALGELVGERSEGDGDDPGEDPPAALRAEVVAALVVLARDPSDPRRQETAVAALGAVGDPEGLPAVLEALAGRPPLRRRAAVALAGFDDPLVEEALRRLLEDRDWQVREVAEELLGLGPCQRPGDDLPVQPGGEPAHSSSRNSPRAASNVSRQRPAPSTTHSRGASTRWTGTAVASANRPARPLSSEPPPSR
jgi:HEAT repeat protein